MNQTDVQVSQAIFQMLSHFGALVATEGVSVETKNKINTQMQKLIDKLDPVISKLSLASAGILTN